MGRGATRPDAGPAAATGAFGPAAAAAVSGLLAPVVDLSETLRPLFDRIDAEHGLSIAPR